MKYYIKDHGSSLEDAIEFGTSEIYTDICQMAEEAAEDHFRDGGWEDSWPITFTIVDNDGKETDVDVECENVPLFTGRLCDTAGAGKG